MIRISSDHTVFLWAYNTYKIIIAVETDDILMATQNIICFETLTKDVDTSFDCGIQEGTNIKLHNISILQIEYGISIYKAYHIIKNII